MKRDVGRREFLPLAGVGLASGCGAYRMKTARAAGPRRPSAVTVLKARSYAEDLAPLVSQGIEACGLQVRGKRVLLKPNLVEFDSATCINTDPSVVAAAVEAFERLGALEVLIGEGPGHRRDTLDLAYEARYFEVVPQFERRFIDLNRDDVAPIGGLTETGEFFLPKTALRADLIVSLAKMKTHHWAGATLAMKNFFGVVPGAVYGWPKNQLHYMGIDASILALSRFFQPKSFAIVDGIVGMEGNGPIQGTPTESKVLVFGNDLAAVDATCCRIMGIDPNQVGYLAKCETGNIDPERIEQRGESIASVERNFALIARHKQMRRA